jgi:hypothetical protein
MRASDFHTWFRNVLFLVVHADGKVRDKLDTREWAAKKLIITATNGQLL